MAIGTVKFFDLAKGFGFIVPGGGGKDIFVNRAAVERAGMSDLAKGLHVSFETELDAKGAVQAAKLEVMPQVTVSIDANEMPSTCAARGHQRTVDGHADRENLRSAGQPASKRSPKVDTSGQWQRSYDQYCDLARNAGNDAVTREQHWQRAEHFLRMMNGSAG